MTSRYLMFPLLLAMAVGPAQAASQGDWIFRAGASNVSPDESSGRVAGIPGSRLKIDDAWALGLNLSYMLSDNWAVELLASTPFTHDIQGNRALADAGVVDVGEIDHLPPTLSLQYHFQNGTALRPYVGLGANYTIITDEKSRIPGVTLDVDNSFGAAAQVGVDYELGNGWLVNADVRYIDLDTDAELRGAINDSVDVSIDPWVFTLAAGFIF